MRPLVVALADFADRWMLWIRGYKISLAIGPQAPGAYKVTNIRAVKHVHKHPFSVSASSEVDPPVISKGSITALSGFVNHTLRANCEPNRR